MTPEGDCASVGLAVRGISERFFDQREGFSGDPGMDAKT
ncbi:hypothetical protein B932_2653 [Gluconobacter oxydans H24]|nr:hypothetical protein B932_2653 [Gluconobacter oxydans H24]